MTGIRNPPFYIFAAGLFIILKFGFTVADNDNLAFLLKPTDLLAGWLIGSTSVYVPGQGYFHESLNILINKSCAGFNFWLLCFLMLTFLALRYFNKTIYKLLIIPLALWCAYLATIFVNTSRIFASIVMQHQANNFLPVRPHLILHEVVGVTTNLVFLILIYYLAERLLIKHTPHAQPA